MTDDSQLSCHWPRRSHHQPNTPGRFINREQEIEALKNLLVFRKEKVVAITGSSGTGKTALVRALTKRLPNEFNDLYKGGIFFIDAQNESSPPYQDLLLEVLSCFGEFYGRTIELNAEGEVQTFPSADESHRLVVIDEFDRVPEEHVMEQLKEVLAHLPAASLLLVSRRPIQTLPVAVQVNLDNFNLETTATFISSEYGIKLKSAIVQRLYQQVLGNPRAILELVESARYQNLTIEQSIRPSETLIKPGLLDPYGRPLTPDSESYKTVVADVTDVNDDLLRKLSENPSLLYELTPRAFEEIVSELLRRLGYQTTLTQESKDGGKDIYVARKNSLGSFLYLIECKRYAPDRPVGVGIIRQLYGVVQAEKATAGILVTTSFFTKGAREFRGEVAYQISLQDYLGLQIWLKSAVMGDT